MAHPLRFSAQRQTVLRLVKFSAAPVTAVELWPRVRKLFPHLSKGTLYRNLESLVAAGEISETLSETGVHRYVGSEWHQATFTCQRCGKERALKSRTLPSYVDRKMFGRQIIFSSSLRAVGICGSCAKQMTMKK